MSKRLIEKISPFVNLAAAPFLALLASPGKVFAQPAPPCDTEENINGICLPAKPDGVPSFENLGDLIGAILEIALLAVGMIAVLFVVIGGYQYLVARGNEEQTESAKKTVLSALLGVVIVLLAYSLVRIVTNILTV